MRAVDPLMFLIIVGPCCTLLLSLCNIPTLTVALNEHAQPPMFVLLGRTASMCSLAPAVTGTAGKSHLWARLSVCVCLFAAGLFTERTAEAACPRLVQPSAEVATFVRKAVCVRVRAFGFLSGTFSGTNTDLVWNSIPPNAAKHHFGGPGSGCAQ